MIIRDVDTTEHVLVVAEIGNNHEGSFEVARELVHKAAESGADAVKFQTFQTKLFVSTRDKARYDRFASFELSYPEFERLQQLAQSLGLLFLSTPLDLESARFLNGLVDCYKIASGDNNFYPLLECVCETGKPIIMSSGLSDLDHIRSSKQFIVKQWQSRGMTQDVAVLHCVTSYPLPPEQANLAAIPLLARELGGTIGYSDHTIGVQACVMAVTLGAQIIEKHFTLDKHYSDFRDHQLSADPLELQHIVEQIRDAGVLLGKPEKALQPCETELNQLARRSIAVAAHLPRGHRLTWDDLMWIRPASGLPPGQEHQVVGKTLQRDLACSDILQLSDLE